MTPPLPQDEIEAYERDHQIRLPAEYRNFLLHVGQSGAGPAYGLYPLRETSQGNQLHLPSPLHPEMAQGNWEEVLGLPEDSEAVYHGFLTLLTQGCTYDVLLMTTGPYRGRIVYVDWNMEDAPWFSQFPDFLTWYETWLRETLAGYEMTWYGHGLPVDETAAAEIAVNPGESVVRRTAALNTLIRAPRLSPSVLDQLRQGAFAGTEVETVTPLLVTLAHHGANDLGALAWQWLRKAPPEQAVRLVDAMSTMGTPDWAEAAYHVLEQGPPRAQFESLLFKLSREKALTERAVQLGFASSESVVTAIYLNRSLPDPLPVPEAFLTHPDPSVRRYAVEYQPEVQLERRIPTVLALLEREESEHVRQGWVLTLGKLDTLEIRQTLVELLSTEPSPVVKSAVTGVIERQGWAESVPALIELTRHGDGVLRLEAARALGVLGDERARPALEALLGQEEHPFRDSMGYGYTIAQAARQALQALIPARRGLAAKVREVIRSRKAES